MQGVRLSSGLKAVICLILVIALGQTRFGDFDSGWQEMDVAKTLNKMSSLDRTLRSKDEKFASFPE